MTAANVIDRVRANIKDNYVGYYRWSDEFMFDSIDEAQRRLAEERPASLFTTAVPTTGIITEVTATSDVLQVNNSYKQAMVNYVCYRCLNIDSEDGANIARAEAYLSQYKESIA